MKHISFFTIALVVCSVSFAQTKVQPMTEQEVITLLCHKWKYTGFESDGLKLPLPRKWMDAYLLFKSDGTIIKNEDGEDIIGKWTYEHKKVTLKIEDKKGTEKLKIIKITDTEFISHSSIDPVRTNITMIRIE